MFRKRGKRVLITRSPRQFWDRLPAIAAGLALLVGAAGFALMSFGPSTSTAASHPGGEPSAITSAAPPSATPLPSLTATAATPVTTETASPVAQEPLAMPPIRETTPAPQAAVVPPSSDPVTITFDRIGLQGAPVAQMTAPANGGVIEPPTDSQNPDVNFRPYWISSFGKPGKDATDTVYVVGHACSSECWQPSWSVFNHLGEAQVGDRISFQTQTGTVTYEVTKTIVNRKNVPEDMQDTWNKKPGEMRIIACSPTDFDGKNVTVFAKLVQ